MKKLGRLNYETLTGRILPVALAILFLFCVGPAYSASDPGTVTIVLAAEPFTLDPGYNTTLLPGQVMRKNIFESLTDISPTDSSISPRLATSWKQIDANTWHFLLRKGVKFHDGADFNAEAVVFNLNRLYDKKLDSTVRAKFFSGVKVEGKALDSLTLELKTDKPEPLLLTLLANFAIASPNTPSDKWTRNPIGTGPYKFIKWDAGTQIILERFDGYWGKQPQVKKAVYLWRGESAVRAAMVAIGEADLTPNIKKEEANRPDMDYSYLTSETASLRIGGGWEAPLNDKRVRMALNYAVDRNSIRGSILSKDAIPASQMVIPSTFGYNPDLKVWPYDPQQAKKLLDEARKDGVPVDKEILMVGRTAYFPGTGELMEAVMAMYKAVGLNMKLKMVEDAVHNTYQRQPYPTNVGPFLVESAHDNNSGDAVFTLPKSYSCKGTTSPMCDKSLDALIDKGQVATGEERRKIWQAVFKRIHDDIVPDVMLFHLVGYCRVGKRITYKPSLATNVEIQLAQITFK